MSIYTYIIIYPQFKPILVDFSLCFPMEVAFLGEIHDLWANPEVFLYVWSHPQDTPIEYAQKYAGKLVFRTDMSFPTLSHLKNPSEFYSDRSTWSTCLSPLPRPTPKQNMAQHHTQRSQPSQFSWRQRRSSPCCRASYRADPSAMPPLSFRGRPAWCRAGRL